MSYTKLMNSKYIVAFYLDLIHVYSLQLFLLYSLYKP